MEGKRSRHKETGEESCTNLGGKNIPLGVQPENGVVGGYGRDRHNLEQEDREPSKGRKLVPLWRGPSTFSKEAKERFPKPARSQPILPVHTVWVQLQLICLPDKSFHIAGNSREDPGVLRFYEIVTVEHTFCHRRFVWMSKPSVIFYSGLCRSTSLSDVHLTTLTGYDVYPRSPQAQVADNWTQETGDMPRRHSDKFNIAFGQHSAELAVCRLDIWNKSD